MYVFCDPSGHQPLHCTKTLALHIKVQHYDTSYIKSRSSKRRNRVAYVCLVTVQLVSVTLQILRKISQICDLCSFSAYI